jgi:hypothetical protein
MTKAVAAAGIGVCLIPAAAVAANGPTVTVTGGLTPTFSPAIANYTVRCATAVTVSAQAPAGWTVGIDGKAAKSGTQTVSVKLAAGQRFKVTARHLGKTTTASVRCIPEDFPKFEVTGQVPAAFPLFAFSNIAPVVFKTPAQPYAIVADRNGVPIWWVRAPDNLFNVMGMTGGRIAAGLADGPLTIYTPKGSVEKRARPTLGQPDAHEAIPTSRGTFYLGATSQRYHVNMSSIGQSSDGSALDSVIEEVSSSGKSLWSWNSAEHFAIPDSILPQVFIPLTTVGSSSTPVVDVAHINSIEDDGQGGIIASFRNTSAVYRIIKATGQIDWKLGGTTSAKSLTVVGDDAADRHLGGQHDARVLPDGTISVLDNGWGTNPGARVTRWRIDRAARTATLVESLVDSTIGKSICCGSARRGSDGSWLVGYGAIAWIRAYDKTKKQVFSLHFTEHGLTYRATPIPTSQLTASTLISGMDFMHKRS